MPDLEPDVPQRVEDLFDERVDVGGHRVGRVVVQKQHVHVAEGVEFAPPIAADGDQGRQSLRLLLAGRAGAAGVREEMAQEHVEQGHAPTTDLPPTPAGLVRQAQPVVLDF